MRNNQIQILDSEIEQLILTKNGYIRDNNDLTTSIQEKKVEIHDLEIKSANIISNETARLQEINKDFLQSMDLQNKTLLTKEECLFVLLSHLSVNINKTGSLWGVLIENVWTIGDLMKLLIDEIEKYKLYNKDQISKLNELEDMEISIQKLLDSQKDVQSKLQEAQSTINSISIMEWEVKQARENIEKEKGYIESERLRLSDEDTRIKSQWKALENTKNYLKWQSQS